MDSIVSEVNKIKSNDELLNSYEISDFLKDFINYMLDHNDYGTCLKSKIVDTIINKNTKNYNSENLIEFPRYFLDHFITSKHISQSLFHNKLEKCFSYDSEQFFIVHVSEDYIVKTSIKYTQQETGDSDWGSSSPMVQLHFKN